MSKVNYVSFLGKHYINDELLKEFLNSFNEPVEVVYDRDMKDYSIELKQNGVSCYLGNDHKLNTIFFHSKDDYYGDYLRELPFGIKFTFSYEDVIERLGKPDISGGGKGEVVCGIHIYPWVRYDYSNYSLHFVFPENKKSIKTITIMALDVVPRP